MTFAPSLTTTFLIFATVCILLPHAHAFGAGDIPDFAYLNDKAFRHGDIESILENLAKTAGNAAIGGSGILEFAASVVKHAAGPSKFSKSDIKKVYFGNWLRDYSQAMDIAGLSKLSADTLILVVSVLGFMTFGFSTDEFQITADRLGVYLPVEHIDNPKGYAEKEGDARSFHPKLRPPVQPQELEIDQRTGMKKYMATEHEGFDTSTAFIRRTLKSCIEHGRRAQGKENADLWEAYRLLGTGLHTLEDFTAHSNWCELALRKMGHREVFCHVGDRVSVNTPNGPAPPLVTGTFGSADFLHSLLGEAGDKLSQASVTDLSGKLDEAASQPGKGADLGKLKSILGKIMGGGEEEEKLNQGEQLQQQAQGYHFNPDNIAPPEVQQQLKDLLRWHDDVMRGVIKKISMVPGLANLLEEFSNALNAYIYTVLAPYLTPILTQATSVLNEGSKAVIDNDDQYEVFNNPDASDPSHSMLSKDHFGLILNEPAGKIAQIIVEFAVNEIVQAWSNDADPDQVLDKILEAFHHPYYANNRRDGIQHKMFEAMQKWLGGLGPDDAQKTIQALTKENVRDHKNKRLGSEDQSYDEPGYGSCGHGHTPRPTGGIAAGIASSKPSYKAEVQSSHPRQTTSYAAGQETQHGYGGRQQPLGYGGQQPSSGYGRQETQPAYGGNQQSFGYGGGRQESTGYGGGRQESSGYGGLAQQTFGYGGRQETTGYGGRTEQPTGYGGGRQEPTSYGGREESSGYGSGRQATAGYGGRDETSFGYGGRQETTAYGGRNERSSGYGGGSQEPAGYGGRTESSSGYGGRIESKPTYGRDEDDKPKYGGAGYGGQRRKEDSDEDKPMYGGGTYGGSQRRKESDDEKPKYGEGGYRSRRKESDDEKPKYGGGGYGGQGHRRNDSDDDKRKYGGGAYGGSQRRKDSDDEKPKYGGGGYGSRRNESDDEKPKYGGGNYGRRNDSGDEKPRGGGVYGGYSSQRRKDSDDEKSKKYKSNDSDDEDKKKKKYGKKNKDSNSDDDSRKEKGNEGHRAGYAPSYQPGYAPSYGGQNATYGVERMSVRDDDSDDERRKRQGGGGYGGGYGGGRY